MALLPCPPAARPPAALLLAGLWAVVGAAPVAAHPSVDPATVDLGHPTGHVHDHADQTWPPQPRGIENVVLLEPAGEEARAAAARKLRGDALERIALARSGLRQALGTRFNRTEVVEDTDKAGGPLVSRLVYFSLSRNATVEVTLDGQDVRNLRSIPAAEYQPEITDTESSDAARIARAWFLAQGKPRVRDLQAFGILAYQPAGKGFYPTRVIYVSFHRDSDAPPEFVAWVDLTRQRVLRGRQEGQQP